MCPSVGKGGAPVSSGSRQTARLAGALIERSRYQTNSSAPAEYPASGAKGSVHREDGCRGGGLLQGGSAGTAAVQQSQPANRLKCTVFTHSSAQPTKCTIADWGLSGRQAAAPPMQAPPGASDHLIQKKCNQSYCVSRKDRAKCAWREHATQAHLEDLCPVRAPPACRPCRVPPQTAQLHPPPIKMQACLSSRASASVASLKARRSSPRRVSVR